MPQDREPRGNRRATALALLLTLAACAQTQHRPAAPGSCGPGVLDIDGNRIWASREGSGEVTVVFEAGFGNDSSVWSQITPRARAAGMQTFVYDRAGMGKSTINTATPYSLDNDVHILRATLTGCGVAGPIVMVAHSYGGAMSLLAAAQDRRVRGVVLLDAMVPGAWTASELEHTLGAMRAQYAEIRQQAPALARVAIPWAEALPETVTRLDAIRLPPGLPIIDIVAEHGRDNPASAQSWRDAHTRFVADRPERVFRLAAGSSHKIAADKPDLVVDAIMQMRELARPRR